MRYISVPEKSTPKTSSRPTYGDALCWINGEVVPASSANISVLDHGLLYGDGVFEGLRFYRRRIFKWRQHLQRLRYSARAIGLTVPLDDAVLFDAMQLLATEFAEDDGYLRLVVTRGSGPMGLDPSRCDAPTVFIVADKLSLLSADKRARGAQLIIATTRRLGPDGLDPRIKSLNYLNHILARIEANHAGADEAILLNGQGRVAEASSENIFIVRDKVLLTPPVIDGALDGITRNAIIELARQLRIECREVSLAPYDLYNADECFLTGTGAELIAARSIDGRALTSCPGPVFERIQRAFGEYVLAQCEA